MLMSMMGKWNSQVDPYMYIQERQRYRPDQVPGYHAIMGFESSSIDHRLLVKVMEESRRR